MFHLSKLMYLRFQILIELTSEITLEMKWPSYDDLISLGIKDTKSMAQECFCYDR
jgi:hypothetical protein